MFALFVLDKTGRPGFVRDVFFCRSASGPGRMDRPAFLSKGGIFMSEQSERKRVILSGIQPTGTFTLGNYIGAVRNWAKLQDQFDCLYMVADLHALTVRQEPAALRRHTREAAAMLLAAGIDPARSILFVQSHVPAHTQLNWILCCNAQFGELSRMTQLKDKSAKHHDNVNGGLFTYPALMAADILIYNEIGRASCRERV